MAQLRALNIVGQNPRERIRQRFLVAGRHQDDSRVGNRRASFSPRICDDRKAAGDACDGAAATRGNPATDKELHVGLAEALFDRFCRKHALDFDLHAGARQRRAQRRFAGLGVAPKHNEADRSTKAAIHAPLNESRADWRPRE
jgi:hypothetical protein